VRLKGVLFFVEPVEPQEKHSSSHLIEFVKLTLEFARRKLVANFKHSDGAKDCLVIGIDIALRVVEAVVKDRGHLLATTLPSMASLLSSVVFLAKSLWIFKNVRSCFEPQYKCR